MKRLLTMVVVLLCLFTGFALASAQAQNSNGHDTVGQEQAVDQLLLDLFNQEISNAVTNFYKEDSIHYQFNWWDKDYDVVEVDQSEKGHMLKYDYNGKKQHFSYVIRFTVQPQKDKILGTDTITFGVQQDSNLEPIIKMLNYEHNEPQNND